MRQNLITWLFAKLGNFSDWTQDLQHIENGDIIPIQAALNLLGAWVIMKLWLLFSRILKRANLGANQNARAVFRTLPIVIFILLCFFFLILHQLSLVNSRQALEQFPSLRVLSGLYKIIRAAEDIVSTNFDPGFAYDTLNSLCYSWKIDNFARFTFSSGLCITISIYYCDHIPLFTAWKALPNKRAIVFVIALVLLCANDLMVHTIDHPEMLNEWPSLDPLISLTKTLFSWMNYDHKQPLLSFANLLFNIFSGPYPLMLLHAALRYFWRYFRSR